MDIFASITVSETAQAEAEADIANAMRLYDMDRLEACRLLVSSWAELIAEDAILRDGRQWQSRLDRYVHVCRQREAAYAELRASL